MRCPAHAICGKIAFKLLSLDLQLFMYAIFLRACLVVTSILCLVFTAQLPAATVAASGIYTSAVQAAPIVASEGQEKPRKVGELFGIQYGDVIMPETVNIPST